jgi:DNA topoisomerase-1
VSARAAGAAVEREVARSAGLRYATDAAEGIARVRAGRGFGYRDASGRPVRDEEVLERIRALVIPPAWTEVWISPDPLGHIQATGRDARGRKQYLYHPDWRALRDATKFDRMIAFGTGLPRVRQRIEADLALPGMPRERALAAVLRLVDDTLIRVGSREYLRTNGSVGATTLRRRHAHVEGWRVTVDFPAKGGKQQTAETRDMRLARAIRDLQELPGQDLFDYLGDGGERRHVRSDDVNAYLRELSGDETVSVKDFRTWGASALCCGILGALDTPASQSEAKRTVAAAMKEVAGALGNTPAVARASYVHPIVPVAYADGSLRNISGRRLQGLDRDESRLLRLLRASS